LMLPIPARSVVVQASRSKGELHPTRAGERRVGGSERSTAPWALHVHRASPRPAPSIIMTQPRGRSPGRLGGAPCSGSTFAPKRVVPSSPLTTQLPTRWVGAGTLLTAMLPRLACSARITTPPPRRFRRQPRTFLSPHARCTPGRCATHPPTTTTTTPPPLPTTTLSCYAPPHCTVPPPRRPHRHRPPLRCSRCRRPPRQ